jgi:hypothetical protein
LGGGDRRPALGGEDAKGAILGAGEVTATGSAVALGGGEPALAWRRRRGLLAGEAAKASRCIVLASASWDLSTAVAIEGGRT